MPEYDDNLDAIFAQFRTGDPLAVAAGADAARDVIRRRRRTQAITASTLAALVIATPVVAYAGGGLGKNGPPPTPGTSPGLTGSPFSTPSVSPTTATPPAPDGRISVDDLGNATLDVPAWPDRVKDECPAGIVKFTDGTARSPGVVDRQVNVTKVVYLDVDGDGAIETAARLICDGLENHDVKVIAFDRNAAGEIVTLGQVLTNAGDIAAIFDIRAAGTAVEVEVADYFADGMPGDMMQRQRRAYSWNGSAFVQSGGPTAFPPNPKITDLSVTGGDLLLAGEDQVTGTLTLTVRNRGPQRATSPEVAVTLPKWLNISTLPAGCTANSTADANHYLCKLAALNAGASRQLTLPVRADRSAVGDGGTYSVEVRWLSSVGGAYPDPEGKEADNRIDGRVSVQS